MRYIEEFVDERLKAWCIHCGSAIADVESNRDHVPTKSLLTKNLLKSGADFDRAAGDELGHFPQVLVCRHPSDVVQPALDPADPLAAEQLRLAISYLEFVRTRLDYMPSRRRFELRDNLALAQALLSIAGDAVNGLTAAAEP